MRRQATLRAVLLVSLATAAFACDEPPPGGVPIDREVFIETYVELRLAALRAPDFVISPEQRDQILSTQGVDQERLLHFAETHGEDLEFMNEVWAEVERRLQERASNDDASA